ncbi:MAG: tetraacyldisaccharide 4'-kinase [Calditrichota bacterium]
MVHSSDRLHSSVFLTGEFPPDRPAAPAFLTVPLSRLYGYWADRYHRRFDPRRAYHADVPVISVGNIAVGGTGKTPFVIALAKLIGTLKPEWMESGKVVVLSRGYGRESREMVEVESTFDYRETGDEPLLIKRSVPWVQVIVYGDRAVAARQAVRKLGAKLLIIDDGFQHRRLARDLDIVLVDGPYPLGNGFHLPAGPLREGKAALRRASVLVGVGDVSEQTEQLAQEIGLSLFTATRVLHLAAELSTDLSTPVYVLTSIARPDRFLNALVNMGVTIVGRKAYPDHHRFTEYDIHNVTKWANQAGARLVITTAKDAIRVPWRNNNLPLRIVEMDLEISPIDKLKILLEPLLRDL